MDKIATIFDGNLETSIYWSPGRKLSLEVDKHIFVDVGEVKYTYKEAKEALYYTWSSNYKITLTKAFKAALEAPTSHNGPGIFPGEEEEGQ